MKVAPQSRRKSNQNLKHVAMDDEILPEVPIETSHRVLALDLGVDRCGLSVVELRVLRRFIRRSGFFKVMKHQFQVLHVAHVEHTISDFSQLNEQSWAFTKEVVELTERFSVDALAVERYQQVGPHSVVTMECCNAMLGILSQIPVAHYELPKPTQDLKEIQVQRPMPLFTTTAQSWKTKYAKANLIDLQDVYEKFQEYTEQQVDATAVACTALTRASEDQKLSWSLSPILRAYHDKERSTNCRRQA